MKLLAQKSFKMELQLKRYEDFKVARARLQNYRE
jgi:hypothetical protein